MNIWIGELYTMGYTLTIVTDTEDRARKALIKEYRRAYKQLWGVYPDSEMISNAKDDINVYQPELNKVEWR